MISPSIPLPSSSSGSRLPLLADAALERFVVFPGGKPRTRSDLLVLLVLAWMSQSGFVPGESAIAARVQLVYLGLGDLVFSSTARATALGLRAAQVLGLPEVAVRDIAASLERQAVNQVPPMLSSVLLAGVDARVDALWAEVCARRDALARHAHEVEARLAPLLPEGRSLAPHQLEALARIEGNHWKLLLADDMGLGKTVVTLAALLLHSGPSPVLIVAPKSMVGVWGAEIRAWCARRDPLVLTLEGTADIPKKIPGHSLVIVLASWGLLSAASSCFTRISWRFVVADESQALCNAESGRTRAFLLLRRRAEGRLLLSGTQDPNGRAMELWAPLRVLDEGAVPDRRTFGRLYCDPKPFWLGKRRVTRYDGRSNHTGLAAVLARWQVRRVKAELPAGTLPDKTRYAVPFRLSSSAMLALDLARDQARARLERRALDLEHELLEQGAPEERIRERVARILLASAVSEASALRIRTGELKVEPSVDLLRDLLDEGHRPVVFTAHHRVARHAIEAYGRLVTPSAVLSSFEATTAARRAALVARWERGEGRVLVLTRKMHAGVTLVSSARMVMLERFWLPAEERQAEDRIYRIGQRRDVAIYYCLAPGTMDDAMTEVVTWKEAGSEALRGSAAVRVIQWLAPRVSSRVGEDLPMEIQDLEPLEESEEDEGLPVCYPE